MKSNDFKIQKLRLTYSFVITLALIAAASLLAVVSPATLADFMKYGMGMLAVVAARQLSPFKK